MTRYVLRRLAIAVVLTGVVATLVFFALHMLPGDPALVALGGQDASPDPEAVEAMRHKLGLDRPLWLQFVDWFSRLLRGDLGASLYNGRPVALDLALRLGRTLELVIPATLLGTLLGIPLGVFAAVHRGRMLDPIASVLALVGFSIPVFVLGVALVWVFALELNLLPASGYVPFLQNPSQFLRYLALPTVTLSFGMLSTTMRMTRSCLLEQLGADYVRTARSKGLNERAVVYRHALRNALLPVTTVVGLQIGLMLGGSVLVEYIFNWPGMSNLLVRAVGLRDYPVVQGILLVIAFVFIGINLAADIVYGVLDPRVRYD